MKTYSVKQIAEMLDTSQETVRRWIRDKKLKAVQVSKKDGNVIYENDFQMFLDNNPKHNKTIRGITDLATSAAGVNPMAGVVVLTAGLATALAANYISIQNSTEEKIRVEDFKKYLLEQKIQTEIKIKQKEALIAQTQDELKELQVKRDQYKDLMENEKLMKESIEKQIQVNELN